MKQIIFLLVLACFLGCHRSRPPKPKNLISKDKMVDVLYDVTLMNAAKGSKRNEIERLGINPEKFIFDKYQIDSLQFALSHAYYAFDIQGYDAMLETVQQRLEARKKKYKAIIDRQKEEQAQRSDSVNKARDSILKIMRSKAKDNDSIRKALVKKEQLPN